MRSIGVVKKYDLHAIHARRWRSGGEKWNCNLLTNLLKKAGRKKVQKWIKWENMGTLWIFDSFEGQNTIPFTF
jgi:hypothetical protein